MIFKRPYAFLIKYFKLINIAISLLFIYIVYKNYKIVSFFNDYIFNNYSGNFYKNFYLEYISPITTLVFLLIFIGIAIILWLFIYKKKPFKLYVASISYYILLFIFFNIIRNTMITLETSVISAETSRIYRDLSLIFILPQIYFIIFYILRGLGLNINKFNFDKDLKELEVSNEDNEEVEVTLKKDTVKIRRNIRRYLRELIYYIKENKFLISIISVILLIIITVTIFNNLPQKIDDNYRVGNSFTYKGVTYHVNDSILTNIDYQGNIITPNKYYLAVFLNISNNNKEDIQLDYNNFRLILNDKNIYPILDKSMKFIDYAKEYNSLIFKKETTMDFALVFELDKEDLKDNYKIKFASGSTLNDDVLVGKHNYIKVNPTKIYEVKTISTSNLQEYVSLDESNLKYTKIKIDNPEITNRYVYNYEVTYNGKTSTYKDIVFLNYTKNDKTLLVLDYDYKIDEVVPFANTSKSINGFVKYFVKIKYIIDGESYYSEVTDKTPNNLEGKIVLETINKIKDAENIYFAIIIRDKEYLIVIK